MPTSIVAMVLRLLIIFVEFVDPKLDHSS